MAVEGSTLDFLVHAVTVTVAAVLTGVAFRAYRKQRSSRFRFVLAAFAVFAFKEALLLANVFWLGLPLLQAVAHTLNLAILALFFYGVVR